MSSHQQQLSALFAAASRTLSSVRLVLEHGEEGVTEASADASGDTVLHVAARHERWDVCSWLSAAARTRSAQIWAAARTSASRLNTARSSAPSSPARRARGRPRASRARARRRPGGVRGARAGRNEAPNDDAGAPPTLFRRPLAPPSRTPRVANLIRLARRKPHRVVPSTARRRRRARARGALVAPSAPHARGFASPHHRRRRRRGGSSPRSLRVNTPDDVVRDARGARDSRTPRCRTVRGGPDAALRIASSDAGDAAVRLPASWRAERPPRRAACVEPANARSALERATERETARDAAHRRKAEARTRAARDARKSRAPRVARRRPLWRLKPRRSPPPRRRHAIWRRAPRRPRGG